MPETDTVGEIPEIPPFPPGLKTRGKQLWTDLHTSADFTDCPETRTMAEEACYLVDEITRQRRLVRAAGRNTRVKGSNGQPVSMPEIADLQKNQGIMLSLLKSLRMPSEPGDKLTPSEIGKLGAAARWENR
ncbi:hypothetical protein MMUR_47730 [Mycolicibacterium murale]|uniref:Terminase n=1 Tax=Mycolicibacterium murale TaxID=182220 RepID=A0A7I9WTW7_9MYCO|nr:hypothetical protein [Mycolicibacterium murale]MCV7186399.1 hypothetical protein [Mycolicibacterium murale]GFG60637.1 hypothetical protein MMUR_47730 [Mycolicibacterium murale]